MRILLVAITTLLFITACGPRWYYPHLDWLVPWYVGDYISLDRAQHSELEIRLARQLNWHCRTQRPEYAVFLRKMGSDFDNPERPVTSEQYHQYLNRLTAYWKHLMARIGPEAADLLRTATDEQIAELFVSIEEDNQELTQTYVDPPLEEILQNRYERMTDRLEQWLGDLTLSQDQSIRRWSEAIGATSDQWIANRRRVQQAFRTLLAQRTSNPSFNQEFTALLMNPETLRSEAYQARLDRNIALTIDLLTEIGGTLTRPQRAHLISHSNSLARDFEILACEIPPEKV